MFNLGEKVTVRIEGEITEIRKVGDDIRYTISGDDKFSQAFVFGQNIIRKEKDYVTANKEV